MITAEKDRRPKTEIRKKTEIRSPKAGVECNAVLLALDRDSARRSRISAFGLLSDFQFRISDFIRPAQVLAALALVMFLTGCATPHPPLAGSRPFRFQTDTFSFANGLVWQYHYNAKGNWVHEPRKKEPSYVHHCFVIVRSAKQFFQDARFDPNLPVADDATYRALIRKVVSTSPRRALPPSQRIVIPGYANLRKFSEAHEKLLKEECGGAWECYLQRGNWRMVFPFSRASQVRTARRLVAELKRNRPPVVHLVRFPQLTINHAVLLFGFKQTKKKIVFSVYDPNQSARPTTLTFDRATKTFLFPASNYFPGGWVDVYEVYRNWDY